MNRAVISISPLKLKNHSAPIAIILVAALFTGSFLVLYYSSQMQQPSLPQRIMPVPASINNGTAPAIAWVRNYTGQENADYATRIVQAKDGGYVIAGVIGDHKYSVPEGWLVKIDDKGKIEWNQTFVTNSGNLTYKLCSIAGLVQTQDGGYAVAGTEASDTGVDYAVSPTYFAILFKTDSNGQVEWNQTYSQLNGVSFMVQTSDGGYALTGDYSLVKTNSLGKTQWQESYNDSVFKGNAENNNIIALQQSADGGYALLTSNNILFKVTSAGNLQWQQTYQTGASYVGAPGYISAFIATSDSGYLLAGDLYPNNATDHIATLIKVDSKGDVDWSKNYVSLGSSVASLMQTGDGGYAFAGTLSHDSVYPSNLVLIVKTDSSGNQEWNLTNNGTSNELYYLGGGFSVSCIIESTDGSLMVAGSWDPGATGLDNAYYISKTEAVSPPPTPTPLSQYSPFTQLQPYPLLLGILAAVVTIGLLIFLMSKHRRQDIKLQKGV